ncbi:hypothetical protein RJ639_008709 [Escallonia herrerae]|uniref:Carbonic anhydrase n=1 Tax=Escallonia herrerae TaxID=1293975 RepID=A0AA89AX82_9ASTE|nr:hypothetical protein RJ639_008709 [Escallonia herrerae]
MANFRLLSLLFASLLLSSQTLLDFCHAEGGPEVDTKSRVVISEDESPFSYKEEAANGPKQWGSINSTWKNCGDGKFQSPIDVPEQKLAVPGGLGRLKRNYKPAPAQLVNRGHDISLKWNGDAGELQINGTDYKLQQCHWHSPSEHTINGRRFAMEVHMVHMTPNHDVAVVGILYKFGRPDPFLAKLLSHIKTLDKKGTDLGIVNPQDINFGSRKYYRYFGSLTVPPCTEGVTWTVVNKVRTVSREQLSALRNAVHDGFEENARPVQALAGRQVYLYAGQ